MFDSETVTSHLSVEEENLAVIPSRFWTRASVAKIEIADVDTARRYRRRSAVAQGNDLGLPTEQDLDIFVALACSPTAKQVTPYRSGANRHGF
jgi:hypothetical protein